MVYAVGVADAGITLAGGTERRAGDDGDLLFPQQLLAELAAGQAADLDRREHVECAPRLKVRSGHIVQRLDDVAAAAVVLVAHHLDLVVALAQRVMAAYWLVVGADMMQLWWIFVMTLTSGAGPAA